jgi:hypothetical protein
MHIIRLDLVEHIRNKYKELQQSILFIFFQQRISIILQQF